MYQPSTPPVVPPHSGRTGLLYGILTGLGLGIVQSLVIAYLSSHANYGGNPYIQLGVPFSLLLWIIVLLVVGALAGKRTAKIVTGTLAGLWAGMIGGVITAVSWFSIIMASSAYSSYMYPGMVAANMTYMIILILAALGVGTGLGALGGLIGQSFAPLSPMLTAPYQQRDVPPAGYRRGNPIQAYQPVSQQSDPPQQEQELVQYQQNSAPRQEPQD